MFRPLNLVGAHRVSANPRGSNAFGAKPLGVNLGIVLIALLMGAPASAQVADNWDVVFPTSESGAAQEHFLEGVTYMHLHMFEDAEEHFREAQRLSPDFAMAYWGQALNQHRTIWNIHNYDVAWEILERLGRTAEERAAKALTQREKSYLAAIELLFGEGTLREREAEYSASMFALSERYPEDIEAAAWSALSLMRINAPGKTRQQTRSLMAGISLRVLAHNPRHPGANRYLIQSTDDPENTDLGIIAVNNLAMVETDAAEALHIPSHFQIQHGMWKEAAEANMRAFESSMRWVDERGWSLEDLNSHNYGHLLQFANYAYLQAGLLSKAAEIRERVKSDFFASGMAAEIEAPFADVHARWVLDLEQWQEAASLADLAREHSIDAPGLWLAIGIAAVKTDDRDLAVEAMGRLDGLSNSPSAQSTIAARQVDAQVHLSMGHTEIGLEILKNAVEVNWEQPGLLIGSPPRPVKPVLEQYGEALLEAGQAELALANFQRGLTRYRERTNLLLGAARAAERLNRRDLSENYYSQLAEAWADAEDGHSFVDEVMNRVPNRD